MCGIVGYIGHRDALPVLLETLRKLEYRGYDSAGVALLNDGRVQVVKTQGKLANLVALVEQEKPTGTIGVGHTRWATHGKPSTVNAHPHRAGKIAIIHNGIIENHIDLKQRLLREGAKFKSETDTEILAHLVNLHLKGGSSFEEAVRSALLEAEGSYAVAVLSEGHPDQIIAAKNGASPLILGYGEGENFIASDIPAILAYTQRVVALEDGQMAVVTNKTIRVSMLAGREVSVEPLTITWSPVMAEKGGYKHYMQKEIFEQPRAIVETIGTRVDEETGHVSFDGFEIPEKVLAGINRVHLVACGTAWHAALIGKFMIEELARIPAEVDLASEYRYRNPIVGADTLLIAVSQSGETADTLAALREGKQKGAFVAAISNTEGSGISREAHSTLYTHAGPEIGVASTKCFTTQIVALYLLAIHLGRRRKELNAARAREHLHALLRLPKRVEEVLDLDGQIKAVAKKYSHARDFLYLGRGTNYPIALEGALKLKEISYIHAEGYPAGEMKHGPIALIDEKMPVVILVTKGKTYEKVLSNMEEVRARDGRVIALATEGDPAIPPRAD
ncbi:MAG: glutamine--fructose-6-phosphate transaminase (isomerizing), partial [Deltaproteobacteria bacterium]|nr:glutamine--fructose-6-phosphate transaminase (isomerizing) [Deltaproteobacteria bacterium]